MSTNTVALLVGTVLAVAALAFVLYPLFFSTAERPRAEIPSGGAGEDSPILALREIEFDRATGKLSDTDYAELKKTYSERALRELRAATPQTMPPPPIDAPTGPLDAIEARVREYRLTHRECPTCGVRPESDAAYCSTCGGYLARVCPSCAEEITESGAAFCSTCGTTLAQLSFRAPHPSSRA